MKKVILFLFSILSVSSLCMRAEVADREAIIDDCPKMFLSSDAEKRAIEAADKVCDVLAGDIDRSTLTPVLFRSNMEQYNPDAKGRRMISVQYMKSPDSYIDYGVYDAEKKTFVKHRKPSSVICVELYLDTYDPVAIGNDYMRFLSPDFETFVKNNPGFKIADVSGK